jgi:suppressor of ftsI
MRRSPLLLGIPFVLFFTLLLVSCGQEETDIMEEHEEIKEMEAEYDEMMREHCQMMPGMDGCEPYLSDEMDSMTGMMAKHEGSLYTQETTNLKEVSSSQVYDLENEETITLTASIVKNEINGVELRQFAYDGQIPGPTLKVHQGDTIYVDFINDIDVETTVHWHGLRLENAFDGVPGVTQDPVLAGASFRYKLDFPDEGIYWYHPHIREDYQQEMGLYGNILVLPEHEDYYNAVNKEELLVLDDILLDEGGLYPFYEEFIRHALMGRFGNTMLVNGITDYTLDVEKGEVVRFYVTNVANTRTFKFSIPNAQIKLVGSDVSSYQHEEFVDEVIIAPAERYVVEVLFDKEGTYTIVHETDYDSYEFGTISVSDKKTNVDHGADFYSLNENEYVQADIATYESYFDKAIDETLVLTIDMEGMGDMMMGMEEHLEPIEWEDSMPMMNSQSTNETVEWIIKNNETQEENMNVNFNWKAGDVVKIRLFNDPESRHPMQHPIHFHGQRFLVLEKDGETNTNLAWKDTVLVAAGSYVDILLEVTNPGEWMAHCHIAEHLQSGMMLSFEVEG